jgi:hypothetical protein
MQFKSINEIGPSTAKGKMFKLKSISHNENRNDKEKLIKIPAGSIGYCCFCDSAQLYLAFEKEMFQVPRIRMSPTSYPILVRYLWRSTYYILEIES